MTLVILQGIEPEIRRDIQLLLPLKFKKMLQFIDDKDCRKVLSSHIIEQLVIEGHQDVLSDPLETFEKV